MTFPSANGRPSGSRQSVRAYRASQTAILFPPGGYHWPGMGSDLDTSSLCRSLLTRAELALLDVGVPADGLAQLMAGENQVQKHFDGAAWSWTGDFPLTVAAQTIVGAALAEEFFQVHGTPRAILGESMGEAAAYCASGALEIEEAVLLAYHWARALQQASDTLGLRMIMVVDLTATTLEPLLAQFDARVVIYNSLGLHVCALPRKDLGRFEAAVSAAKGSALVSYNPCASHDPRLRAVKEAWTSYDAFVQRLSIRDPLVPLCSTISPGKLLSKEADLRANLLAMSFAPVRWAEAVSLMAHVGVRNLLQLGAAPSAKHALKRLRHEEPALRSMRVDTVGSLEAVQVLPRRLRIIPPPLTVG